MHLVWQASSFVPVTKSILIKQNTVMKTKHLLTISLIFSTMSFTAQAKADILPGFNTSNAAIGHHDKDSALCAKIITGANSDSTRIAGIEGKAGKMVNIDVQNMSLIPTYPASTTNGQVMGQIRNYDRHPYRANGIASGGVLTIILYALYAVLR
jgi:hypothetical protein